MAWWNWLIWSPRATAIVQEIDARLESLLLRYVRLAPDSKLRVCSFTVQMVAKMIPNYDFGRGFYLQFFTFSLEKGPEIMMKGIETLTDLKRGAQEGHVVELEITFDLLINFFALLALRTRSARASRLRGEVYATRSRAMNDLVQTFLAAKLFEVAGDWVQSEVFYPPQ